MDCGEQVQEDGWAAVPTKHSATVNQSKESGAGQKWTGEGTVMLDEAS